MGCIRYHAVVRRKYKTRIISHYWVPSILHMLLFATRNKAPRELIRKLLDADVNRESIMTKTDDGDLPLHIACHYNLPIGSLKELLEHDTNKRSVFVQDNEGWLALDIVVSKYFKSTRGTSLSYIELVLQSMLRIQRIGLLQWKNEIHHKMIQPLLDRCSSQFGEDLGILFFYAALCAELKTLLEKSILLELISWKMCCVREYGLMPQALSEGQKKICLTRSGADVIVEGVMSFLENEPIVSLLASYEFAQVEEVMEIDEDVDLHGIDIFDVMNLDDDFDPFGE